MNTLSIDIETYSEAPIAKTGSYRYASDPSFEVLLFAYSVDGGPVEVVDLASGEELPEEVRGALTDPAVEKWAFNAAFERVCLSRLLGQQLDPEQWRCTMVWASTLGLPMSLQGAGAALNLSEQKIGEGKNLIRYFCQPCKPTKTNGGRTRNRPEHAPEKWAAFVEYCRRDVEVEQNIQRRLAAFPVAPEEWELYALDQRINDLGIRVDVDFAARAIDCDQQHRAGALRRSRELTGLDNPNAVGQLHQWLGEHGTELPDLTKASVAAALDADEQPAPEVVEVLRLRQELSRSSTRKYEAMLASAGDETRARGLLQFVGAGRTGRWAGRLIQVQNLPRNEMADLGSARELVASGAFDALELLYPSVPDTLSQLIRTAFVPKPGHHFIVADFSAIEARVLAWLAGEQWRIDLFTDGGDIYCQSAAKMFGVPVVKHGVNGELRQKGKIAELACIAAGQLVLTDKGEVPIEHVTTDHRVWDGVEFVHHEGLIDKGVKDVITYDGLTATPDHLVWVEGQPDPVRLEHAAASSARLARSGAGRTALWLGRGHLAGETMVEDMEPLPSADAMHELQQRAVAGSREPAERTVERLSELLLPAASLAEVVGAENDLREAALHQPERQELPQLRGTWDRVQVPLCDSSLRVDCGEPAERGPEYGGGPDRQRRPLRTGEPSLGSEVSEPSEPTGHRPTGMEPRRVAVRPDGRSSEAVVGDDRGADHRGRQKGRSGAAEELAWHRGKARVYDLLNAGPRHRFVVSGRLVHNCGYGGSVGALTNMGALQLGLEEGELKPIVDAWRKANPNITDFWWSVDNATKHTVATGETVHLGHGISTSLAKGVLFITLPSGRRLAYPSAKLTPGKFDRDQVTYRGLNTSNQWTRIDSYGPKFVENIVQAASRDLLAHALRAVAAAGHRIVMHVHDEIVVEEPLGGASVDDVVQLMTLKPDWAEGLPLDADGYSCRYYKKD